MPSYRKRRKKRLVPSEVICMIMFFFFFFNNSFTELRHVLIWQNDRTNFESRPRDDQQHHHQCAHHLCTAVKRMRSLVSARQHAQHTNTHWPTFQLNKSWQIKPKTQPNEQYKQPLKAGIKWRTLALPFVHEYLFNWGPKYFLLQDFYKGTDNKVTPCDLQKEKRKEEKKK